jgi:DNA-binding MarR family transcriptional regulator
MNIEEELLNALQRFSARHEKCHVELSQEINISELKVKQFRYIEIIHQNEYLTFSRFAELLGITKPSITNIVNQLIKLECVRKTQCSRDGRKYYVELSEKGEKIAVFQHLTLKRMVKKIVVELTETELEIFISLLNKIIKE